MKLAVTILFLIVFSCTPQEDLNSFHLINVQEYNDRISLAQQQQQTWPDSPISIINELFPPTYERERGVGYSILLRNASMPLKLL